MNLLTSLALLGFVSRALAHAQLVLLAEMQQENLTNDGRSNLSFDGSKVTIDDAVSTEFTIGNDEDIPGGKSTSMKAHEINLLGRRHLVDFATEIPSYPSSIPSGATELPGLHGRTPLIWKWDESITKATKSIPKSRRGERKSNDFASSSSSSSSSSNDCDSSSKNLGERSSKTDDDDNGRNGRDEVDDDDMSMNRRISVETARRSPNTSSSQRNNNNNNVSRTTKNRSGNGHRRRDNEDVNYDEDGSDSQARHGNRRNRKQNRRRVNNNRNSGSNGNSNNNNNNNNNDNDDEFAEEDDEITGQVDAVVDEENVDIDQSREIDGDFDGQGEEEEDGRDESSSGESSRRGGSSNRRRHGHNNAKRTYGSRRRNQGFIVDGVVPLLQESLKKPYPKRPSDMVELDLSSKPYPKDRSSESSPSNSNPRRRFKVLQRPPYSAPYPAGFPSAIRPSDELSKSHIWTTTNSGSPGGGAFVISSSPDNSDGGELVDFGDSMDHSSLEEGATLLDTLTGQTYEISLDSASRSSPLLAALALTDSAAMVQPASSPFLTKSPVIRTPGESFDSVLGSLLIPSNQPPPGLSFIEPMAA